LAAIESQPSDGVRSTLGLDDKDREIRITMKVNLDDHDRVVIGVFYWRVWEDVAVALAKYLHNMMTETYSELLPTLDRVARGERADNVGGETRAHHLFYMDILRNRLPDSDLLPNLLYKVHVGDDGQLTARLADTVNISHFNVTPYNP